MRVLFSLILFVCMISCNSGDKQPDVSGIEVNLKTLRFEKDFFAIDTGNIAAEINKLNQKYPSFAMNYFSTILNADPGWGEDTLKIYLSGFINAYRSVYDTAMKVFPTFEDQERDLKKSIQYLKYYFPKYQAPEQIITYIGPLDGYGDILGVNSLIVGLHHHLGKDFSLYKSDYVNQTYPEYISKRFEPNTIPVNCMKIVILDLYPEDLIDKSLVVQMVEKGKQLFLLSKLVPYVKEHTLIGFSEKQLKESYQHERVIWDLFTQNNILQSTDHNLIKNYIGESPKTMELGEASPGNIGSFTGWQIVKKYMNENEEVTLQQLMETSADKIFTATKYKP